MTSLIIISLWKWLTTIDWWFDVSEAQLALKHRGLASFPRVPTDRSQVPVAVWPRKTAVQPFRCQASRASHSRIPRQPSASHRIALNRRGTGGLPKFDSGVGQLLHKQQAGMRGEKSSKKHKPNSQWRPSTPPSLEVHQIRCRQRKRCRHLSPISRTLRSRLRQINSIKTDNRLRISLLGRRKVAGEPHAYNMSLLWLHDWHRGSNSMSSFPYVLSVTDISLSRCAKNAIDTWDILNRQWTPWNFSLLVQFIVITSWKSELVGWVKVHLDLDIFQICYWLVSK